MIMFAYGFYNYTVEAKRINTAINNSLLNAAQTASFFIGDEYHDRVRSHPPTKNEEKQLIQILSSLAETTNVIYIYSMVLDENKTIRFTSSSALAQEIASGNKLTHFYDKYEDNKDIFKAFNTQTTVFDMQEQSDQWGKFRSIFIPHTTALGHRYIIGADIKVDSINKLSHLAAIKAIILSMILMLGGVPFLLLYRHSKSSINRQLKQEIADATEELQQMNMFLEDRVKEKTKQLITQSFEDTLTGLQNRNRLLYDMKNTQFTTLMIINIQNFKEINDFFGIRTGDELIKQMAKWLLGVGLFPYRLGGDEFAVLSKEKFSHGHLERQCTILLHRLNKHSFIIDKDTKIALNVTVGIETNLQNVSLVHADIALHKAKEDGKYFAFYDDKEQIESLYQNNIIMSRKIKDAIRDNRIVTYFQPIVSVKTGEIVKYETLVRMIDIDGTVIPPFDFLKIAQKTRMYLTITKIVTKKACELFSNRDEEFSINLSIQDILDQPTVNYIEKVMLSTNTANKIVFEILESEGIENFEEVAVFIHRMKNFGAKIAIDDFGSGYSSFENIASLEIDYIKIDGSLIKNIVNNPKHAAVVEAIADFALKINAKTIAEYVASSEIYEYIKTTNITYVQGYYLGKPEPLDIILSK
jgi:diguanylate cyclase (GGDEF)-like protein